MKYKENPYPRERDKVVMDIIVAAGLTRSEIQSLNSLTAKSIPTGTKNSAKSIPAGTKNYRFVESLRRNSMFFALSETQNNYQPPPPWWAVRPSYGMD